MNGTKRTTSALYSRCAAGGPRFSATAATVAACVIARINLGRLLHAEANLVGAEAHFREAVRYDPACALAWYNLGVVLEDLERADDALPCYEQAIHADAALADAHWNLSLLYERGGRHRDALRHLSLYRKLTAKHR